MFEGQVHLRTATNCRAVLHARPHVRELSPGFGSTVNNGLRAQHDGLLPVQQAQGPLNRTPPVRAIETHHGPLFEALALAFLDFQGHEPSMLVPVMKIVSWTHMQETLRYLAASLTEDFTAEVHLIRHQIFDVIDQLGDHRSWAFLCEVEFETADSEHLLVLIYLSSGVKTFRRSNNHGFELYTMSESALL